MWQLSWQANQRGPLLCAGSAATDKSWVRCDCLINHIILIFSTTGYFVLLHMSTSVSMVASTSTIILLSSCSFIGNIGAALTGFGQAIIFLFVWQIVDLAGYDGDFKNAVFIQALSLFSMQVRKV